MSTGEPPPCGKGGGGEAGCHVHTGSITGPPDKSKRPKVVRAFCTRGILSRNAFPGLRQAEAGTTVDCIREGVYRYSGIATTATLLANFALCCAHAVATGLSSSWPSLPGVTFSFADAPEWRQHMLALAAGVGAVKGNKGAPAGRTVSRLMADIRARAGGLSLDHDGDPRARFRLCSAAITEHAAVEYIELVNSLPQLNARHALGFTASTLAAYILAACLKSTRLDPSKVAAASTFCYSHGPSKAKAGSIPQQAFLDAVRRLAHTGAHAQFRSHGDVHVLLDSRGDKFANVIDRIAEQYISAAGSSTCSETLPTSALAPLCQALLHQAVGSQAYGRLAHRLCPHTTSRPVDKGEPKAHPVPLKSTLSTLRSEAPGQSVCGALHPGAAAHLSKRIFAAANSVATRTSNKAMSKLCETGRVFDRGPTAALLAAILHSAIHTVVRHFELRDPAAHAIAAAISRLLLSAKSHALRRFSGGFARWILALSSSDSSQSGGDEVRSTAAAGCPWANPDVVYDPKLKQHLNSEQFEQLDVSSLCEFIAIWLRQLVIKSTHDLRKRVQWPRSLNPDDRLYVAMALLAFDLQAGNGAPHKGLLAAEHLCSVASAKLAGVDVPMSKNTNLRSYGVIETKLRKRLCAALIDDASADTAEFNRHDREKPSANAMFGADPLSHKADVIASSVVGPVFTINQVVDPLFEDGAEWAGPEGAPPIMAASSPIQFCDELPVCSLQIDFAELFGEEAQTYIRDSTCKAFSLISTVAVPTLQTVSSHFQDALATDLTDAAGSIDKIADRYSALKNNAIDMVNMVNAPQSAKVGVLGFTLALRATSVSCSAFLPQNHIESSRMAANMAAARALSRLQNRDVFTLVLTGTAVLRGFVMAACGETELLQLAVEHYSDSNEANEVSAAFLWKLDWLFHNTAQYAANQATKALACKGKSQMAKKLQAFLGHIGAMNCNLERLLCEALSPSPIKADHTNTRLGLEAECAERYLHRLGAEIREEVTAAIHGNIPGATHHGATSLLSHFAFDVCKNLRCSMRRLGTSHCFSTAVLSSRLNSIQSMFDLIIDNSRVEKAFGSSDHVIRQFAASIPGDEGSLPEIGTLPFLLTLGSRLEAFNTPRFAAEVSLALCLHTRSDFSQEPRCDRVLEDIECRGPIVPIEPHPVPVQLRRTMAYSKARHKHIHDTKPLLNYSATVVYKDASSGRLEGRHAPSIMQRLQSAREEEVRPCREAGETAWQQLSRMRDDVERGQSFTRDHARDTLYSVLGAMLYEGAMDFHVEGMSASVTLTVEELVGKLWDIEFLHTAEEVVAAAISGRQLRQFVSPDHFAHTAAVYAVGTLLSGLLGQAPGGAESPPWSAGSVFSLLKLLSSHTDTVMHLAQITVRLNYARTAAKLSEIGARFSKQAAIEGIQGRNPELDPGFERQAHQGEGAGPGVHIALPLASLQFSCVTTAFRCLHTSFADATNELEAACSAHGPTDTGTSSSYTLLCHRLRRLMSTAAKWWEATISAGLRSGAGGHRWSDEGSDALEKVWRGARSISTALTTVERDHIPNALQSIEHGFQISAEQGASASTGKGRKRGIDAPSSRHRHETAKAARGLYCFLMGKGDRVMVPEGKKLAADSAEMAAIRCQLLLPHLRIHFISSLQSAIRSESSSRHGDPCSGSVLSKVKTHSLQPLARGGPRYLRLDAQSIQAMVKSVCGSSSPAAARLESGDHSLISCLFGESSRKTQWLKEHGVYIKQLLTDGVSYFMVYSVFLESTGGKSPHPNADSLNHTYAETRAALNNVDAQKVSSIVEDLSNGEPEKVSGLLTVDDMRHIVQRYQPTGLRPSPQIHATGVDPGKAQIWTSTALQGRPLGSLKELKDLSSISMADLYGDFDEKGNQLNDASDPIHASEEMLHCLLEAEDMETGIPSTNLPYAEHMRARGSDQFRRAELLHREQTGATQAFQQLSEFSPMSASPVEVQSYMMTRLCLPVELRRDKQAQPRAFAAQSTEAERDAMRYTRLESVKQLAKRAREAVHGRQQTVQQHMPILADELESLQHKPRFFIAAARCPLFGQVLPVAQAGTFAVLRGYHFSPSGERIGPVRAIDGHMRSCACAARRQAMAQAQPEARGYYVPSHAQLWPAWRQGAPPRPADNDAAANKKEKKKEKEKEKKRKCASKSDASLGDTVASLKKAVRERLSIYQKKAKGSGKGAGQALPAGGVEEEEETDESTSFAEEKEQPAASGATAGSAEDVDESSDDDEEPGVNGFAEHSLGAAPANPVTPPLVWDGATRSGGALRCFLGTSFGSLSRQGTQQMRERAEELRKVSSPQSSSLSPGSIASFDAWLQSGSNPLQNSEADVPFQSPKDGCTCDLTGAQGGGDGIARCVRKVWNFRLGKLSFRYASTQERHAGKCAKEICGAAAPEAVLAAQAEADAQPRTGPGARGEGDAGDAAASDAPHGEGRGRAAGGRAAPLPWATRTWVAGRNADERQALSHFLVREILAAGSAAEAFEVSAIADREDKDGVYDAVHDAFRKVRQDRQKRQEPAARPPPAPQWRAHANATVHGFSSRGYLLQPPTEQAESRAGKRRRLPASPAWDRGHGPIIGPAAVLAKMRKSAPRARRLVLIFASRHAKVLHQLLRPASTFQCYLAQGEQMERDEPQEDRPGKLRRTDAGAVPGNRPTGANRKQPRRGETRQEELVRRGEAGQNEPGRCEVGEDVLLQLARLRICAALGALLVVEDPGRVYQRKSVSEEARARAEAARGRFAAEGGPTEGHQTPVGTGASAARHEGDGRGRVLVGLDGKPPCSRRMPRSRNQAGAGGAWVRELTKAARQRERFSLYATGGFMDGRRGRGGRYLSRMESLRAESAYVAASQAHSAHLANLRLPNWVLDTAFALMPAGRRPECLFPDFCTDAAFDEEYRAAADEPQPPVATEVATAAAEGEGVPSGPAPAEHSQEQGAHAGASTPSGAAAANAGAPARDRHEPPWPPPSGRREAPPPAAKEAANAAPTEGGGVPTGPAPARRSQEQEMAAASTGTPVRDRRAPAWRTFPALYNRQAGGGTAAVEEAAGRLVLIFVGHAISGGGNKRHFSPVSFRKTVRKLAQTDGVLVVVTNEANSSAKCIACGNRVTFADRVARCTRCTANRRRAMQGHGATSTASTDGLEKSGDPGHATASAATRTVAAARVSAPPVHRPDPDQAPHNHPPQPQPGPGRLRWLPDEGVDRDRMASASILLLALRGVLNTTTASVQDTRPKPWRTAKVAHAHNASTARRTTSVK